MGKFLRRPVTYLFILIHFPSVRVCCKLDILHELKWRPMVGVEGGGRCGVGGGGGGWIGFHENKWVQKNGYFS